MPASTRSLPSRPVSTATLPPEPSSTVTLSPQLVNLDRRAMVPSSFCRLNVMRDDQSGLQIHQSWGGDG
jgi:hypothetical protein